MQRSPNLSREVLLEALNSYELPNVLLTEILSSNPTAAKDPTIREEINNRLIPFEDYEKQMIDLGMYWVSYKEKLESQIAQLQGWIDYARNLQLDQVYSGSGSTVDRAIELITLMGSGTSPMEMYERAMAMRFSQSTEDAIAYIQTIDDVNDLNQIEMDEQSDVLFIYSLLIDMESGLLSGINYIQEENLRNIVLGDSPYAASLASEILFMFHKDLPIDSFHLPQIDNRNLVFQDNLDNVKSDLELFPNPTSEFVVLKKKTKEIRVTEIRVLDMSGKVISSEDWLDGTLEKLILTGALECGVYQVSVLNEGLVLCNLPIVVIK